MPSRRRRAPQNQTVDALYVWIAIRGGREAVISALVPLPGGIGQRELRLSAHRRNIAERYAPLARRAKLESEQTDDPIERVELRCYRRSVMPEQDEKPTPIVAPE